MKKIIEILSIFGVIVSISVICNSCKTTDKKEDSDLSALVECSCNDLDCWRKKTSEKTAASFKCAAEAGFLAVGIGLADKIKKLATTSKKASDALQTSTDALEASKDVLEAYEGPDSLTSPTFWSTVVNSLSGKVNFKKNGVDCGIKFATAASALFLLARTSINYILSAHVTADETLAERMTEYTLNNVKNTAETLSYDRTVVSTAAAGFTLCATCFATIASSGANHPIVKFINGILAPLEEFLKTALTVYVLADCGYQITTSSLYLLANTKCLASDLVALADSYKALERMNDNILSNQLDCDQENTKSCSYELARRYGISLARMISNQSWPTYWSKGNRAYQCYRYCYTYAGSKEQCYSVSLGDDLKNSSVCKKKCEEQTGDCLSFCASYCCNGNGNCTKEVHKYRNK